MRKFLTLGSNRGFVRLLLRCEPRLLNLRFISKPIGNERSSPGYICVCDCIDFPNSDVGRGSSTTVGMDDGHENLVGVFTMIGLDSAKCKDASLRSKKLQSISFMLTNEGRKCFQSQRETLPIYLNDGLPVTSGISDGSVDRGDPPTEHISVHEETRETVDVHSTDVADESSTDKLSSQIEDDRPSGSSPTEKGFDTCHACKFEDHRQKIQNVVVSHLIDLVLNTCYLLYLQYAIMPRGDE
ncbi:hypothetical protein AKJ16_DCAP19465 [Drosera capensis]